MEDIIGTGSFGTVRKCRDKSTGELFACKTIRKDRVEDPQILRNEIDLLAQARHPHIIQLLDVYEDVEQIHIVTELCTGGELYDRVVEKAESEEKHFEERDAARIIRDILDAIAYCHDHHIVHRDLKPENFLLKDESEDADVKIIDFGLSRNDDKPYGGIMSSRVGTPYYVAPEVLSQSYTNKCDVWSIGVITYILLCGFPPFNGGNDYEIIMEVEAARISFPSPEWDDMSGAAKDFVAYLLQKDPIRRPTAKEALEHAWITDNTTTPVIPAIPERVPLERRVSSELRLEGEKRTAFQKFLANIKVKKALGTIAELLTPSEASNLGAIFQKVDNNQDGDIDAVDIDHAVETGKFSSSLKDKLMELKGHIALRGNMDVRQFLAASEQKDAVKREESEYGHDSLGA